MSGRYRYEPSNGWLWILPPVGPSFASVYEKSASGADSNTRAVREIVIELNRLLDRAVYAESHRLTAETALDEAIARADKASNALIRTTAALRETTDRAEKAEARVAELEREESDWKPIRGVMSRTTHCPVHGAAYATEEWGASSPPILLRVTCQRCSWASDMARTIGVAKTAESVNEDGLTAWLFPEPAKTAPQTPVPAPEGTETAQKAPPPSPVGAPRSDQAENAVGSERSAAPVLGHSREGC